MFNDGGVEERLQQRGQEGEEQEAEIRERFAQSELCLRRRRPQGQKLLFLQLHSSNSTTLASFSQIVLFIGIIMAGGVSLIV